MKKSSAIIFEGKPASRAAIVARELEKPCVTIEKASNILKEDMHVTVNGEKRLIIEIIHP